MSHLAGTCLVSWRHTGSELNVASRQNHLESFVNLIESSLFVVSRPESSVTIRAQHRHLVLVVTGLL